MPVPLYIVRQWMEGRTGGDTLTDVEGSGPLGDNEESSSATARRVLRWRGPDDSELAQSARDIRPGDLLVIPASLHGWEFFGHVPDSTVIDVGDEAHLKARALPVLRIHPQAVAHWPDCPAKEALLTIANACDLEDRLDEPDFVSELRGHLQAISAQPGVSPWLKDTCDALARERRFKKYLHPVGGIVLRATKRLPKYTGQSETFADQDRTSSATVIVPLDLHSQAVADRAFHLASQTRLPQAVADDLRLAGLFHDLGKADLRFQRLLRNGNPVVPPLLAKSDAIPLSGCAYRALADRIGYPVGNRHELLSVRLAESANALLQQAHDSDLVLHLIASHHGRCRPFAPVVEDSNPQQVEHSLNGHRFEANSATGLEKLDSGVGERFWRVINRYGWWGSAYLEAILRLADHRQSEAEQCSQEARP
jgi:CRISPR-associated endonuclease/helicase Cas3